MVPICCWLQIICLPDWFLFSKHLLLSDSNCVPAPLCFVLFVWSALSDTGGPGHNLSQKATNVC